MSCIVIYQLAHGQSDHQVGQTVALSATGVALLAVASVGVAGVASAGEGVVDGTSVVVVAASVEEAAAEMVVSEVAESTPPLYASKLTVPSGTPVRILLRPSPVILLARAAGFKDVSFDKK